MIAARGASARPSTRAPAGTTGRPGVLRGSTAGRAPRQSCRLNEPARREATTTAAAADRARDLLVRAPLELAEDDRVPLALGQFLHRSDELADSLALLDGLRRLDDAVEVVGDLVVAPPVLAQQVQGCVVRDAVEPRPQ